MSMIIPDTGESDSFDISNYVRLSGKPSTKDFCFHVGVDEEGFTEEVTGFPSKQVGEYDPLKEDP